MLTRHRLKGHPVALVGKMSEQNGGGPALPRGGGAADNHYMSQTMHSKHKYKPCQSTRKDESTFHADLRSS